MSATLVSDKVVLLRQYARCHHNSVLLDILLSICLPSHESCILNSVGISCIRTLHYAPQRIQDRLRCEVLRGNEVDEVLLPPFFLRYQKSTRALEHRLYDGGQTQANLLENIKDHRIRFFKIC